ncbi:hypothetical protein JKF63_04035 [Porcisia hertigi]|uniref:Uncharacterized protein n=1 Tax=Porcisia hertigi TaxID=2761500 RepID=A0A836IAX3_9TRYP|nr:hypothetical protein JKF63_04035 [Porcisia hertigi]
MDVSQFLKSFKRNVAAKARPGVSVTEATDLANGSGDEDVADILYSDSDKEEEAGPENGEVVVSGRAHKLADKRYAASVGHVKRNQEFAALNVAATNSGPVAERSRFQRQCSALAKQVKDVRKLPRAEMVASVRAELLLKREQLQAARASHSTQLDNAPIQKVAAAMIEVDELLQASAPVAATSTSLLDFLPPSPLPAAPQSKPTGGAIAASTDTVLGAPLQSPSTTTGQVASESPVHEERVEVPAKPPKKKSKFELAVMMAHEDAASS